MTARVPWLVERTLQSVRLDTMTAEWVFDFGDGYGLQVASPWRMLVHGAISLGPRDHLQQFGLSRAINVEVAVWDLVRDRIVREASAAVGSADLVIDFGDGIRLEVFNDSSGYEGWILNAPDGRVLVAQGGGNLAESNRDG
jgi:hypothetical protein